ncbi:MAG: hypothetical protein ACM3SY_15630 [Candidatus Omnitrophota bacterium]
MALTGWLSNFWPGVVTSFTGGYALSVFLTYKNWLPFFKFKNMGIVKIFKNQDRASKSIVKDFKKSQFLKLLAMKGDSFSNPKRENPLREIIINSEIKQQYLISSPDNPYLIKRGKELKMDMKHCVQLSLENFKTKQKQNTNIEFRIHNTVVRFRIILLSEFLYLSFQEVNIPGRESPILKINNDSPIYKCFYSLFEDLWEKYGDSN